VFADEGYRHITDPDKARDLRAHWIDAVKRHPGVWLRHRLDLFSRLLGFVEPHLIYWDGIDPNRFGITHPRPALNRATMRLLGALKGSPLFRLWCWWAASIGLLIWAVRTGRAGPGTSALVASGTLYTPSVLRSCALGRLPLRLVAGAGDAARAVDTPTLS
jgi:hypothetical protein